MELDRKFSLAKKAASFSDIPKVRVGAAIFYKNKLVSIGYNSSRETRMQREYNKYRDFGSVHTIHKVHAEMMALSNIRYDIERGDLDSSKLSIYVYREYANGNIALAKPCKACERALRDYGIVKVHYTGTTSLIEETYL